MSFASGFCSPFSGPTCLGTKRSANFLAEREAKPAYTMSREGNAGETLFVDFSRSDRIEGASAGGSQIPWSRSESDTRSALAIFSTFRKTKTSLAPLDSTHAGPIQPAQVGEGFLRNAQPGALGTDDFSNSNSDIGLALPRRFRLEGASAAADRSHRSRFGFTRLLSCRQCV